MKKMLCLLFALALYTTGCAGQKQNPQANISTNQAQPISQSIDTYFIDGTLENNTLKASQRVSYINKEDKPLEVIYFHLYPNLYKTDMSKKDSFFKNMYPKGFNEGYIDIESVSLLDIPLSTEISDNLIKIKLNEPLEAGKGIILTFKYKTVLQNARGRLGYYDNCYNLTTFYPVAAVYDGEWQIQEPPHLADPSFTDIGNYRVTLRIPAGLTVAATGEYTRYNENGMDVINITADNVREVAIVASPDLKLYEANVDGTTIKSYAFDEQLAKEAAAYAKDALAYFNKAFGKYPYSQLSVAASSFYGGGMEYPSLVLIDKDLYKQKEKESLEWIITHEIAHQWWYNLVGSNPITDSFIDESLSEYSTYLCISNKYDENTSKKMTDLNIINPYNSYKHLLNNNIVHQPTKDYGSMIEVSMLVYCKGAMMYMEMEKIMTQEKLMEAIKSYYENNKFSIVSADRWKDHIKASYEYDWDSFFDKWLYGKAA